MKFMKRTTSCTYFMMIRRSRAYADENSLDRFASKNILNSNECDLMAKLFLQYLPICNNKICSMALKNYQIRFNILPNTKLTIKKLPKTKCCHFGKIQRLFVEGLTSFWAKFSAYFGNILCRWASFDCWQPSHLVILEGRKLKWLSSFLQFWGCPKTCVLFRVLLPNRVLCQRLQQLFVAIKIEVTASLESLWPQFRHPFKHSASASASVFSFSFHVQKKLKSKTKIFCRNILRNSASF